MVLYDGRNIFADFDLTLKIIQMVSQPWANESEINGDNAVLLVYLIAHCYRINTGSRVS